MKTTINFSINSSEITQQINAAVTADAKRAARKIAQEQFNAALTEKIGAIIQNVARDLSEDRWHKSELKRVVRQAIFDAVDEHIKNDAAALAVIAKDYCESYLKNIRAAYCADVEKTERKIKATIEEKLKEYMGNAVMQAVFGGKK